MKKNQLQQLIKEELRKTLKEMYSYEYLEMLKNGEYNTPEEFAQLYKNHQKEFNIKSSSEKSIEINLGRKPSPEELQALQAIGALTPQSSPEQPPVDSEDLYDFVRDVKSNLGTKTTRKSVEGYLGRGLSKPEFNALLKAGVVYYV